MKLLRHLGCLYLEHDGCRVPLEGADLAHIVRMTPQGRKIYFRQKAKERFLSNGADETAGKLLQWYLLPAREWSFEVPGDLSASR